MDLPPRAASLPAKIYALSSFWQQRGTISRLHGARIHTLSHFSHRKAAGTRTCPAAPRRFRSAPHLPGRAPPRHVRPATSTSPLAGALHGIGRPSEAPYGCFLPDLTRFGTWRRPTPCNTPAHPHGPRPHGRAGLVPTPRRLPRPRRRRRHRSPRRPPPRNPRRSPPRRRCCRPRWARPRCRRRSW